jgi:phenylacetic acid degradation operon negative regulatory protein
MCDKPFKFAILPRMKWKAFHHPDISLPVIRRKACDDLMILLEETTCLVLSRGASAIYGHCYPNPRAFNAAAARLQKKGFVAKRQTDGSLPSLTLTHAGKQRLPPYCHPHDHWDKQWNKWWYVLMFDVPERERSYRDILRRFLKEMRLGCLQKSVWVAPWDIRPEYADLDTAASVDSIAFLFEARTVLGYGNQSVVQEAWNFKRLNQIQEFYIHVANKNLSLLNTTSSPESSLIQLLRMDSLAYAQAMSTDPLLPKELLPKNYEGMHVAELHTQLIRRVAEQL